MKIPSLNVGALTTRFSYGKRIMPVRDWLMLLAGVGVLVLCNALWNVYTFVRASHGETITLTPAEVSDVSETQKVSVTEILERRAQMRARFEEGPLFVDPGI